MKLTTTISQALFDATSESRDAKAQRLAQEEEQEYERLQGIKSLYNNTPLRRILSYQLEKDPCKHKTLGPEAIAKYYSTTSKFSAEGFSGTRTCQI
jgi:hypothetical protein